MSHVIFCCFHYATIHSNIPNALSKKALHARFNKYINAMLRFEAKILCTRTISGFLEYEKCLIEVRKHKGPQT